MNGILLGLCVLIMAGPNKGQEATAVDYKESIYTVEWISYNSGLPWQVKIKMHELNVKECEKK